MNFGKTYHPVIDQGVFVETDGTIVAKTVYDPDVQQLLSTDIPRFSFYPRTRSYGLSAPVLKFTRHTIRIYTDQQLSAEQRQAYRDAVVRLFESDDPDAGNMNADLLALVRSGDGVAVRVLWPGLLHDIIFVIAMIAFFQSFAAARARREREREISANIAAASRCAQCDYDIAGLAHKGITQCPECGHALFVTNAWRQ